MTPEELKQKVRELIGSAKTKEAIEEIIKWAKENQQVQLENDTTLLKADLASLDRGKRLGLLSNSEASTKQNKITFGVLGLLDNVDDPYQVPSTSDKSISGIIKILMLTANPANTTKLNLDREHSIIAQKLQQNQQDINIILKKAVSGTEFKEFTQQEKPDILHFSGHGEKGKYAGIVVQNDDKNKEELIPIGGLKALFKFFKKQFNIRVVLLNACHTQEQAATISEYVDYVIGTNVAIGDTAASAFSSGFYFQLTQNKETKIEDAFDSGRTEAVMKGASEQNFVIYKHGELIDV